MTPEEYANDLVSELSWPAQGDTLNTFQNQQFRNKRLIAQAIRDAYKRAADIAYRQWSGCKLPHEPIYGCAYCLTAQAIERLIKELMK